MTRQITRGLLALLAILTVAAAAPAAQSNQSRRLFQRYTVEAPRWQGPIQGPWEATGGVTVRGPGLTMTCERLKVWFAGDTWAAERITATGNIVLRGRYTATDRTEWDILRRLRELHGAGEAVVIGERYRLVAELFSLEN